MTVGEEKLTLTTHTSVSYCRVTNQPRTWVHFPAVYGRSGEGVAAEPGQTERAGLDHASELSHRGSEGRLVWLSCVRVLSRTAGDRVMRCPAHPHGGNRRGGQSGQASWGLLWGLGGELYCKGGVGPGGPGFMPQAA